MASWSSTRARAKSPACAKTGARPGPPRKGRRAPRSWARPPAARARAKPATPNATARARVAPPCHAEAHAEADVTPSSPPPEERVLPSVVDDDDDGDRPSVTDVNGTV